MCPAVPGLVPLRLVAGGGNDRHRLPTNAREQVRVEVGQGGGTHERARTAGVVIHGCRARAGIWSTPVGEHLLHVVEQLDGDACHVDVLLERNKCHT